MTIFSHLASLDIDPKNSIVPEIIVSVVVVSVVVVSVVVVSVVSGISQSCRITPPSFPKEKKLSICRPSSGTGDYYKIS